MLDSLAPYGQAIALVAAIVAAFGVWLGNRHASNELRGRDQQILERSQENARLQGELRIAAEEALRQVTGQGGYALLVANLPFIEPSGAAIPEAVPMQFGLLNNSDYPVFAVRASILKRVPVGQGLMGSDATLVLQHGLIGDAFPGTGQTFLRASTDVRTDRDNVFDVVLFSRAATFSQRLVIRWSDAGWVQDYELKQLADAQRGIEEKVLHAIRDDFPYMGVRQ